MSKSIKYISSDHIGAPQISGDRWGYCVEMMRICLCEGFNKRDDLVIIEVISKDLVKISFAMEHNYIPTQTIAISNASQYELNTDYFIERVDVASVYARPLADLTSIIGLKANNLIGASCKVAPLGFIEKFRDGNKSAFTTDEEKSYFVIDDTKPDNWADTGSFTQIIAPIVYMTDKMTDINTDGKYIVPFDVNNPDFHKKLHANGSRNGLWNFITCGVNSWQGNDLTQRKRIVKYTIIGNGRFFYFLPQIQSYGSGINTHIYAFGKFNSIKTNGLNDYILIGNNIQEQSYNSYERVESYCVTGISNYTDTYYSIYLPIIGRYNHALLTYNSNVEAITFSPGYYNNISSLYISGYLGNYPDKITGNMHLSQMNIHSVNSMNKFGALNGFFYVYNINKAFFNNGSLKKLRYKNNLKFMHIIKSTYHSNRGRDTNTTQFLYFISLDYSDWKNYD